MKILVIHNEYQELGGEYQAVKNQIKLLRSEGYEVIDYRKDNKDISSFSWNELAGFIPDTLYSRKSYNEILEIIEDEAPDVAHIHNVFPLISPSIYHALNMGSLPIVQTIHNFRFLCPNGLFFINNKICELCKYGNTTFAIIKKCYKESYPLSALYALNIGGHRISKTFNLISKFIVLTEFSASKLIESNFTEQKKISILGNFLPSPLPFKGGQDARENYVVYIGRLSKEKGINILLEASKSLRSTKFLIIGGGAELELLKLYKDENDLENVSFLGHVSGNEKWDILRKASAVVIPSLCYETFSLTTIESMSVGTPVVASRLGSLPFVIDEGYNGLLFEPGDSEDLVRKLSKLLTQHSLIAALGDRGRETVEEKYSQDVHFKKLRNIYNEVLD